MKWRRRWHRRRVQTPWQCRSFACRCRSAADGQRWGYHVAALEERRRVAGLGMSRRAVGASATGKEGTP